MARIKWTYGDSCPAARRLHEIVKEKDDKQLTKKIGRTFARISFLLNELSVVEDPQARRHLLHLLQKYENEQIRISKSQASEDHQIAWSFLQNVITTLFKEEFRTTQADLGAKKAWHVAQSRAGKAG